MTSVSSVTTSTGTSTQTSSTSELGKDDFLQLLVTKLQYQDPLNPMDDEDFVAQLAQYSSLEQLSNISDAIEESNQLSYLQMQSINNTMASDLIGKEVTAVYNGVYIEGGQPANISFTLDEAVSEIEFTIRDYDGNVVATFSSENLTSGVNTVQWDGRDNLGNMVDDGYYYVEATATDTNGETLDPDLSITGIVNSIVYRDGTAYVRINDMDIPLGDIMEIGGADSSDGDDGDNGDDDI